MLLLLLLLLNAVVVRGRSRFVFDGARDEKGYTHYIMCVSSHSGKRIVGGEGEGLKKIEILVYMNGV